MGWLKSLFRVLEWIAALISEGRSAKADRDTKTELDELANEVEAKDDQRTTAELRDILGG